MYFLLSVIIFKSILLWVFPKESLPPSITLVGHTTVTLVLLTNVMGGRMPKLGCGEICQGHASYSSLIILLLLLLLVRWAYPPCGTSFPSLAKLYSHESSPNKQLPQVLPWLVVPPSPWPCWPVSPVVPPRKWLKNPPHSLWVNFFVFVVAPHCGGYCCLLRDVSCPLHPSQSVVVAIHRRSNPSSSRVSRSCSCCERYNLVLIASVAIFSSLQALRSCPRDNFFCVCCKTS